MKTIILITTVFLSQFSLAGTGGGGVMATTGKTLPDGGSVGTLKNRININPEIVFNKGIQNGVAKFAYGQLVDNKWNIQNIEMPEIDLLKDESVIKALEASKTLSDWVEIK